MTRKKAKIDVIRALFAKSGNECAFPGCCNKLVNKKNQFIGQICHIEAAEPGGERYNPNQTDDERRSFDNLVLFCYEHHVETNDVNEYTVEKLKNIKAQHELKFEKDNYIPDESLIQTIKLQIENFWENIDLINKYKHYCPDFKVVVDTNKNFIDLTKDMEQYIKSLNSICNDFKNYHENSWENILKFIKNIGGDLSKMKEVPYYENPHYNIFWEVTHIGVPNITTYAAITLCQIQIKYLEQCLQSNPADTNCLKLLNKYRKKIKVMATKYTIVD